MARKKSPLARTKEFVQKELEVISGTAKPRKRKKTSSKRARTRKVGMSSPMRKSSSRKSTASKSSSARKKSRPSLKSPRRASAQRSRPSVRKSSRSLRRAS